MPIVNNDNIMKALDMNGLKSFIENMSNVKALKFD